ncbi:MAG: preprotein translocase subunit SecB [Chitinophagales bacterium]|jgi:preprotein translocase subunit SecB|tara:strand:+ start:6333 stop:6827 length:495 start_codon:yes stop_codon:yes gene_type:complete
MAEETPTAAVATEAPTDERKFALQRIFIKDVSFENPRGVAAFKGEWKPEVNLDLNMARNPIDEFNWEVLLSLTITVKNADETAFLVEVHQGGVFLCDGLDEDQTRQVLNTVAANILFPYAREAVDNLVVKGGFPPLQVAPINFDALYQQALVQKQAKEAEEQTH